MASNQAAGIAQTPQDPTASSAPFVIHVDAKNNNSSLNPTEAKSMTTLEDGEQTWESSLVDCCDSGSTCCQAWCFPCLATGEAALSIGAPGVLIAIFMLALYIGTTVLIVLFKRNHEVQEYSSYIYNYYTGTTRVYTYSLETFEPKYGLLIGAFACAFVYCLVVCKVRSMVRHFYRIPGSWVKDLIAALLVTCCTVAQMKYHTKLAEAKKKAEEEAATLPAYTEA